MAADNAALALLAAATSSPAEDHPNAVDILVCTHGKRDRCCGSRGTALHLELSLRRDSSSTRVWRTSHLGGHRFAPTVLVLPAGTMWAFMDVGLVDQAVASCGPDRELLVHYRGCAGLDSAEAQVLERAVAERVGWDVVTMPRRTERDGRGRLSMALVDDAGRATQWSAEVTESGVIATPRCGEQPDPDTDVVPQWSVDDLRELAPPNEVVRPPS